MFDHLLNVIREIWSVTAGMASWLLLGFLVAGWLSVFISPAWLERHLGGRGMAPVFKAALFGVPLPLCSCGVIPVAASLRQHGASKAATTAFLLSTPQTGVDSIFITYTLLGPLFAIFRPIIALLTGLLGGSLVQAVDPPARALDTAEGLPDPIRPQGLWTKTRAALDYGLVTLPADIGRALLVGVILAGLLTALIPGDFLSGYLGTGALSIALMMVVGIPLYVCATASVPLAAGFIFLGATPGAALAFLIAGPATNAATLTTISRVLGRRTMLVYLLTVAVSAFGGGLLLDTVLPKIAATVPALAGDGHHHEGLSWFDHLCGLLLVVVMTGSWWVSRRRGSCCDGDVCGGEPDEASLVFTVTGMHCSHCTGSVERTVGEMDGVTSVTVSLDDGRLTVRGTALSREAIIAVVDGLGFKAAPA